MKKILLLFLLSMSSIFLVGCYNTETTTYTLETVESQISTIYEEVSPMTVAVVSFSDDTYTVNIGHGSGLIYDREEIEQGYRYFVITNFHVIESQSYIQIYNNEYYDANVYALNEVEDLALVTFETTEDLAIFGTEQFEGTVYAKPAIGSFVLAVGTPLELTYFNTATLGVVGHTDNPKVIQHDASINPGNSGGPLFDLNGNLLGFNTWKRATVISNGQEISVEGIGFAISMMTAIPTVNRMRHEKEVVFKEPKIGITVTTVEVAIEELFNGVIPEHIEASQTSGIYVLSVVPLRPSDGLVFEKDIITHVNGVQVTSLEELGLLIQGASFNDLFNLTIRRYINGSFQTVTVNLVL
ncbi:MAG: S1C family serine protease [Acholeplasma sp.]|nr:S1C family serine protease [Acholeplasma sp.]